MQAHSPPSLQGRKARTLLTETRSWGSRLSKAKTPSHARGQNLLPWQWSLLLLTIALAAGVRCTTLSLQSLWLDEVFTIVEAGRPWPTLLRALFDPRQGYPLYILAMRLWSAVFGTGEAAMRWPSAIAGVCTVPLLYLLGRRLFGRSIGLLAGLLLALSPLAIWYAQEAKAYAAILLLTVAAWLLLWEVTERPDRRGWWALAAVTLLALLTHRLIAVLSILGQIFYLLYVARQGRFTMRRRYLLVGLLLVVLLTTLAGLWFALGETGAGRQFGARQWYDLANTFTQFSLRIHPRHPEPGQGSDQRPWLMAFAVAALAGGGALVEDVRARGRRRRRAVFVLSFLGIPLGAFFLLYLIRPFYYERYLLGTLPAYLLLLAVGATALWRWARRLNRAGAAPLALLLGATALGTTLVPLALSWQQAQAWTFSPLPQKEQFREAALYLQQHLHPGDLVVVHPGYIQPAVDHYQNRLPDVPLELHILPDPLAAGYDFRDFEADMDALTRGRRRAWLLIAPYHARTWDPKQWASEWFALNPFLHCEELDAPAPCGQVLGCTERDCGVVFHGITLYCVTFNAIHGEGFPTPTISLEATFSQDVLLWGADLEPFCHTLEAGDTLPLTLYARGLRPNLPDLEVVLRLVAADGHVWAKQAGRPLGGSVPTPCWLPGDDLLDYHELLLPADTPSGEYTVQVGYRPAADPAAMLPLTDGSLWARLGTVEVGTKGGIP